MEAKGKRAATRVAEPAETAETAPVQEQSVPQALPQPEAPIAVEAIPAPADAPHAQPEFDDFSREAFAAVAESQAALARGLDALSVEAAGLTRRGIDAAAKSATEMLSVKTIADAIALNAGLTRRSFETCLAGSARLTELGIKLAADAAEPIVLQFGRSWIRAARL